MDIKGAVFACSLHAVGGKVVVHKMVNFCLLLRIRTRKALFRIDLTLEKQGREREIQAGAVHLVRSVDE